MSKQLVYFLPQFIHMSTVIKPAYQLHAGTDIFAFIRELRTVIVPMLEESICQEYFREAVFAFDGDREGRTFREVLSSFIRTAAEQNSVYSRPFDAEVVFFKNPVRGELYVMLYGFPLEAIEQFQALDAVTGDFSYWNNSDSQLEYLSQEAWDDRIVAWRETLNLLQPTGVQGVTMTLFAEYAKRMFSVNDFEKYQGVLKAPTYNKRYDQLLLNVHGRLLHTAGVSFDGDVMAVITDYLFAEDKKSALPLAVERPEFVVAAGLETDRILQMKKHISL